MTIYVVKFLVLLVYLQTSLSDNDWDYIMFVQRWPITACAEWQEKSTKNTCKFPTEPNLWTVHGLWPSIIDGDGPYFCNSSWHYDKTIIEPLLPDLLEHWTNIESNTKVASLWKHEWHKHGTCASKLDSLNGPLNYFKQGINLSEQYSIGNILSQKNVVPTQEGYDIEYLHDSLTSILNVNPIIQCVVDKVSKESLISEIRLCLDKSLQLIDCNVKKRPNGNYNDGVLMSNCNLKKPVMYLKQLPNRTEVYEESFIERQSRYVGKLVELYYSLQFLIWFTF